MLPVDKEKEQQRDDKQADNDEARIDDAILTLRAADSFHLGCSYGVTSR
jgi:hypothetical protein